MQMWNKRLNECNEGSPWSKLQPAKCNREGGSLKVKGKQWAARQIQIFICSVPYKLDPQPGSWEEDHVNVEVEGEEGDDGGDQQQHDQDEGQVRGSQGQGWGQVQLQHCLQYEDRAGSTLSSIWRPAQSSDQINDSFFFRKKMLEDRKRAMKEKKAGNEDDMVIIM